MSTATELQELAMKLPQRSRLKLAGDLLRSLTAESSPRDLLKEAARRDDELDSGKVQELNEVQFWAGVTRRRNQR